MKSPALRRSAFARAIFAIILTCVLITQPLFGAGTPALAEPTEPKVTIALDRVTGDKLPTGSENKYAVTVTCEYMDASVSDKCLDDGTIDINGIPEGWTWKRTGQTYKTRVASPDPQLLTNVDGGKQGASWRYEFVVIPPNHTTPNNTSWKLTATLKSKNHEEGLNSAAVTTTAVAEKSLKVTKKTVRGSTWPGDTFRWIVKADPYKGNGRDLGDHLPTKIEFTDILPEGFEVVGMKKNSVDFKGYDYNPKTRELTWGYDQEYPDWGAKHIPTFEILTTAQEDLQAGRHENKVTAVGTYREADGKLTTEVAEDDAEVTSGTRPEGRGVFYKNARGVIYRSGDGVRHYADGIVPRSYRDARDADWNDKRLDYSLDYDRLQPPTNGSPGEKAKTLVEGTYTLGVNASQGGEALVADSPLYPLTLKYQDDVPCMDSGFVDDGYLYRSRTDGNLCQKPAFHVTAVEVALSGFADNPSSIDVGDFTPVAVLNDGTEVNLDPLGTVKRRWLDKEYDESVVFTVPEDARGKVSRIVADPRRPLQGANNWKLTLGGFAEESLSPEAILQNEKSQVKVWANGEEKPFLEGESLPATLHLLGSLHHVNIGSSSKGTPLSPLEAGNVASENIETQNLYFGYRGLKRDSGDLIVNNLLPRGVSPVTDSSEYKYPSSHAAKDPLTKLSTIEFYSGVSGDVTRVVEPEIIENYRDGRTLIRWKIPHRWLEADSDGYVELSGKIYVDARPHYAGEFVSEVYLTDTEEKNLRCIGHITDDTFDVDGLAATDQTCYEKRTFSIDAPTGYQTLTLAKAVKGPKEDSFAYSPSKAVVSGGDGDVTYRVEAVNSSSDPMSKIVFYDVLPYKGDTGVSSNLADTPRGSTMSGKFTGVEDNIPEGVTVFYSTSTNPCRPEVLPNANNTGCENNWSSKAPEDLGSVKALKFVYEGELGQGKSLTIDYKMSVPEMGPKDVLWNSVAAKASFGEGTTLPAIEAPKVGAARVAEPQFAVEKKAGGAIAENGEWSSTYTVTVRNTGPFEGAIPRVTDTPMLPDGFEFKKVLVDGADTNFKNGAFPVTQGEKLAPGASKSFKVVISGTYEAAEVDWAAVASCEAGDGGTAGGLVNRVTMDGDTDGTENNTACNPVKKDPKFAVKKEASGEASAVNGEWSSTYKVTVSNTGEVKGTSKAVTDTPSVPAGFTVSSAKVDKGEPVKLTDGSFTVTDGVELAPGESESFTVVISGSFDPSKVVESEVSACAGDGAVEGAHGFVNEVTMNGDSDGDGNNTACTTVEDDPKFAVKKEASGEVTAVNGEWSSAYTVTVSNTGVLSGTSKPVTDTPVLPKGFTVSNATVEGKDVALRDGSFTVTDGVELAPGKSKTFTVVISGSFDPSKVVESEVSECAGEGASEGAHGFVNEVTMDGDTDGAENNSACVPVEDDPKFAVKKEPGEASADQGSWSSAYTVTVSNTGVLSGMSQPVTDMPSAPEGFVIENVSVEGEDVALADGSFTVTDGVELAPGESKSFAVVVSGSYEPAGADWASAAKCAGEGEDSTGGGFVNQVTMNGDSDGDVNNTACNAVVKDPLFAVKKEPGEASAENGTWSSTYTVTVSNTGEVKGTSQAVKDTPRVPAGFTVTSAMVEGKKVALNDGAFTVTDGVELAFGGSKSFEVVVSGSYDASADWAAAAACDTNSGAQGGLFNEVSMPGDSDGEGNNAACNAVDKPDTPAAPAKPAKPVKPEPGLPLPRTGAPIGLSAAAGLFAVIAGCTILVAGRRSRRS